MNNLQPSFRFAQRKDTGLILAFIKSLAEYEKMAGNVIATEELLEEWIFDKGKAEVLFVVENGIPVGFALFFHNFSTFLGRAGSISRISLFSRNIGEKAMEKQF